MVRKKRCGDSRKSGSRGERLDYCLFIAFGFVREKLSGWCRGEQRQVTLVLTRCSELFVRTVQSVEDPQNSVTLIEPENLKMVSCYLYSLSMFMDVLTC
jgi:hypothetical protein